MSRWLNQVNNFLETLDGKAETVAEDVVPGVVQSVSSRAKQLLLNRTNRDGQDFSSDDDDGSSYYSEEVDEDEERDASADEEDQEHGDDENASSFMQVSGSDHVISEDDGGKLVSSSEEDENEHDEVPPQQDETVGILQNDSDLKNETFSLPPPPLLEAAAPADPVMAPKTLAGEEMDHPIEPEADLSSTGQSHELVKIPSAAQQSFLASNNNIKPPASNKKYLQMIETLKADQAKEKQSFQRLQTRLEAELTSLHKELKATNAELQQAAITVEQERKEAAAERDDLLEEQEEDLQQCKDEYEEKLRDLREQFKEQRSFYEAKLVVQEQEYRQEGGNLSADLSKLRELEKTARARSLELGDALALSKSKVENLEQSLVEEQNKVQAANERATTAERASAVVEQQLDELQASHSKQLQQRLARESELESTVAELSQQVADAQRKHVFTERPVAEAAAVANYQTMYQTVVEEIDAIKAETLLAQQRCNILQCELDAMSQERLSEVQVLQHQIQDLTIQLKSQNAELDSATNVSTTQNHQDTANDLRVEVDRVNDKVSSLTDQLIRQQGLAESAKSEVLALKGRLQVALARAEAAERQQQQQVDLEAGGDSHLRRRRVKGGHNRFGQLSTRNMRASIGLRQTTSSSFQRQVGDTLDALDVGLMETGNILRHEPLARLGFVLYLCILHLWCFGLIVYHTIQSERIGFSELADRSRIPHIHHNPVGAN